MTTPSRKRQRRSTPAQRMAQQAVELSFAAPQVVGHRLLRMAAAGSTPSARDQKEFTRMGTEKVLAFWQSWGAMWLQVAQAQMAMAQGVAAMAMAPWLGGRGAAALRREMGGLGVKVLAAGLAPVHRAAVGNARRLGRGRR